MYNGYTNYETWLMALNLDNTQWIYNEVQHIVRQNRDMDDYDLGQEIKDFVEETFYNDEYGIYKIDDVWTERDFNQIDWADVAGSARAE